MDEFTRARIERMTPEQLQAFVRNCFESATADLHRAAENLANVRAQIIQLTKKENDHA